MTDRLGHKQTAALFTLMVLNREVSNPDLKKIVGFTLTGPDRTDLVDRKLITSLQKGPRNAYWHELTDAGWVWCRGELAAVTPPPPSPRSTLVEALYVLLGGLHRYLGREKLNLADVFGPDVKITPAEIEKRIRRAYHELAGSPGEWVELADLRPMLGDAPVTEVDAVLKELYSNEQVNLSPRSNRKLLTPADHAAAIRVGGEANHRLLVVAS